MFIRNYISLSSPQSRWYDVSRCFAYRGNLWFYLSSWPYLSNKSGRLRVNRKGDRRSPERGRSEPKLRPWYLRPLTPLEKAIININSATIDPARCIWWFDSSARASCLTASPVVDPLTSPSWMRDRVFGKAVKKTISRRDGFSTNEILVQWS